MLLQCLSVTTTRLLVNVFAEIRGPIKGLTSADPFPPDPSFRDGKGRRYRVSTDEGAQFDSFGFRV